MNTRALNFSKGPMSRHLFRGLEQGLEEERRTPRFLPVYCEADHNNCLSASPSRALCLGTPRLRRRALLSAFDGISLFLLPPSFILLLNPAGLLGSPYLGQRCAVNGVLPDAVPLARYGQSSSTPPPSIFSPHLREQHFFFFLLQCDFFSPLAPFLCLTSIPSRNQHGWLDNFTGSLTPKGTPERRRGSFAPLLIQPAAPPRPLSKLCWPRCVPYPRLAAFQRWWMYTDAWNISMN